MDLPLNALRAFEVSARHLSFTRAAQELHLTQTAVSQHVKNLEHRLGKPLFRRIPRGLALTDEGMALLPALVDAFSRVSATLESFKGAHKREVLSVGAVGTFAVGWLLPRLRDFQARHPFVELRLSTHNNRIDLAAEGLDCAIRFGDGQWQGLQTRHLLDTPLAPMCAPSMAHRIRTPADLARETLLRSYRTDEWAQWFEAAGGKCPLLTGPVFDASLVLADAAAQGAGVALLPVALFDRDLQSGRLARLFDVEVNVGGYWLTRLKTRRKSAAMKAFQDWLELPRAGSPLG
ncbi:LysR family transcriptional regulator [Hydrogenophaga sp.]|uniref:LysR family transcriptional regulator n=1 Tax=Hydrogenophaga sp. TaxID=1904254 RepID=UPI00271A62C7|nr:LysR family transcriptional regulator [Hydrogenophaga sp.]MDO9436637.1 LysR family transcriptional regulator [Hydrogenophaga sp.]